MNAKMLVKPLFFVACVPREGLCNPNDISQWLDGIGFAIEFIWASFALPFMASLYSLIRRLLMKPSWSPVAVAMALAFACSNRAAAEMFALDVPSLRGNFSGSVEIDFGKSFSRIDWVGLAVAGEHQPGRHEIYREWPDRTERTVTTLPGGMSLSLRDNPPFPIAPVYDVPIFATPLIDPASLYGDELRFFIFDWGHQGYGSLPSTAGHFSQVIDIASTFWTPQPGTSPLIDGKATLQFDFDRYFFIQLRDLAIYDPTLVRSQETVEYPITSLTSAILLVSGEVAMATPEPNSSSMVAAILVMGLPFFLRRRGRSSRRLLQRATGRSRTVENAEVK